MLIRITPNFFNMENEDLFNENDFISQYHSSHQNEIYLDDGLFESEPSSDNHELGPFTFDYFPNNSDSSPIETAMIETLPLEMKSELNSKMTKFPIERISTFKHVIYNLLVDSFNNPDDNEIPLSYVKVIHRGCERQGFRFNESLDYLKKFAELYALHIRKAALSQETIQPVLVQDLQKFYFRAVLQLLAKYFEKKDKTTWLFPKNSKFFVEGASIEEAEPHVRDLGTVSNKKTNSGKRKRD